MDASTGAFLLSVVLSVLAVVTLLASLLLVRALRRTRQALGTAEVRLADHETLLPSRFSDLRGQLAMAHAASERALWSLSRLDQKVDALAGELSSRRTSLDAQRDRIVAARITATRLRSGARMLIRAIELRRTILG